MKKLSRRNAIKLGIGLFSFVPAIKAIIEATDISAYEPCSNTYGVYQGTICLPCTDGGGILFACTKYYDRFDNQFCYTDCVRVGVC